MSREPQHDFALSRHERLRRAREFQQVFERGARVDRQAFLLLWQVGEEKEQKVGFTVSRQVRSAVERNRIRRRLREAYRRVKAQGPRGTRYVFVGRPALASVRFGDLIAGVSRALASLQARSPQPGALSR